MAEHFLVKSSIDASEFRKRDSRPVLERNSELAAYLENTLDADAASLFATPIIGRNREGTAVSVSWYSDHSGSARPLSSLDGALRADVADRLTEKIDLLRTKASGPGADPAMAGLVNAALSVRSPEDVLVVGGQPVLINWGTAPAAVLADPSLEQSHFEATLGAMSSPTSYSGGTRGAATAATAGAVAGAALATGTSVPGSAHASESAEAPTPSGEFAVGGGAPPGPPVPPPMDQTGRRWPVWWPLIALCILMGILLLWLLLPGTRLFPPATTAIERELSGNALDTARQVNRDLEERARALEAALEGAVCTPEGDLVLPDGRSAEGLLPPPVPGPDGGTGSDEDPENGAGDEAQLRDGVPDPLVPPDPSRVRPAPGPGDEGPVDNLVAMVEPRTVLVLASNAEGTGFGTGFFIGPDIVATNHHVIEDVIGSGRIAVINTSLGRPVPATLLEYDGPFEDTGGDFALLRVDGVNQPYFALVDGSTNVKGQAVIAAGYPMDIMENDMRFQHLMQGGGDAPDLVVTNGIVNTAQQLTEDIAILVHSASISRGNSGGPLVDLCGRVAGMNTFITEESFRNLNLAQSAANLEAFLARTSTSPVYDTGACNPSVQPTQVPPRVAEVPADETGAETGQP